MFNQTLKEDFVSQRGVYDKFIIDCAFKENLQRKKKPSSGGCDGFEPSITTNGMCYTFNGEHSSDIWKTSEMMTAFFQLFPGQDQRKKTFGGTRTTQGNSNQQQRHSVLHCWSRVLGKNNLYHLHYYPMLKNPGQNL